MTSSAFVSRVLERAAGRNLGITDPQVSQLERYYHLLRKWNGQTNLTALPLEVPALDETIDRLFLEPLVAAPFIEDEALDAVDIGSGGGSPAIPLKIVRDKLALTMVESRARKAAFLREAARHLELANVRVLTERAEELFVTSQHVADIVTIRAVRIDSELLNAVRRLLKPTGRLFTFGTAGTPEGFRVLHRVPLLTPASFLSLLAPG